MYSVSFFQNITEPTGLVVTLVEFKAWLRIDGSDEDTELTMILNAAQDKIACHLNVSLLPYEVRGNYNCFEITQFEPLPFIPFVKWPLRSVTDVAFWNGTDYTSLTITDDYLIKERNSSFPRILFKETVVNNNFDIDIAYPWIVQAEIGYVDTDAVPDLIKMAIMMYGALLYNNRGDCEECECDGDGTATIPKNIRAAISKYKIVETYS